MPELPEVETIRRELAPELSRRRILRVRVAHHDIILGDDTPEAFRASLAGETIEGVDRRGKWLLFRLAERTLVSQLRMTGRFALGTGATPPVDDFRHVAVEFDLDDGRTLFYDDTRRLGGFLLLDAEDWRRTEARFGPEPLAPRFRSADLAVVLGHGRSPIKNALMDQGRIAGIGNIYASEALHRARIDPRRPVSELSETEIRRLHRGIRRVLREALACAGTSVRNYRAVNGRSGSFQERLAVYAREGEPCRRCGAPVERIVQAGRSTYLCSNCQL